MKETGVIHGSWMKYKLEQPEVGENETGRKVVVFFNVFDGRLIVKLPGSMFFFVAFWTLSSEGRL